MLGMSSELKGTFAILSRGNPSNSLLLDSCISWYAVSLGSLCSKLRLVDSVWKEVNVCCLYLS